MGLSGAVGRQRVRGPHRRHSGEWVSGETDRDKATISYTQATKKNEATESPLPKPQIAGPRSTWRHAQRGGKVERKKKKEKEKGSWGSCHSSKEHGSRSPGEKSEEKQWLRDSLCKDPSHSWLYSAAQLLCVSSACLPWRQKD